MPGWEQVYEDAEIDILDTSPSQEPATAKKNSPKAERDKVMTTYKTLGWEQDYEDATIDLIRGDKDEEDKVLTTSYNNEITTWTMANAENLLDLLYQSLPSARHSTRRHS